MYGSKVDVNLNTLVIIFVFVIKSELSKHL